MIINFLQQRQPPILPVLHDIENEDKDDAYFFDNVEKLKGFSSANQESLGGLLFAFFRRFSVEFDYDHQVVSVRQGRYLSKVEKGWDTGRNKLSLCVEEPFNVGRNLGNSADIASVQGLRCEFQRFLEMLIAGEDLETICTPYQPLSISSIISNNEIPANINGNSNTLTLTLPAENRTSSFFLPIHPYSDYSSNTTHPYDRRRSMVDGICSYPSPILLDDLNNSPYPTHSTSYTYRAPPISKPHTSSINTFHPRFSSSQALDTILRVRNTRHGSHPLPPVPSTLLSMLNISANHGTDQSVDKIFARYHRKPSNQPLHKPIDGKNTKKTSNVGPNNRRKPMNNNRHDNNRRPRRRSSGMDWPTISTSASTPTTRKSFQSNHDEPQRSRRWSTTKKQQMCNEEPKQRTLAEIVKIATPPMQPKSPPMSNSPSNTKNNRHRRPRNNNKSCSTTINNKPKKKTNNSKPPRA